MTFSEYDRTDGLGLAERVAHKDVTAAELLEEAISRAERFNPALNAVVFKDYERARTAAHGPLPAGPFVGVPFLFKDIFAMVQGTPTRQGSRFFPAFPADHDSYLTTRFKRAGLVAFGKTNVPVVFAESHGFLARLPNFSRRLTGCHRQNRVPRPGISAVSP